MKGRELRTLLVDRDGPRCFWCRRPTRDPAEVGDLADNAATVDHLDTPKPRRHAQPDRAVVACRRCNHDRGCLTVDEWRAVLRYRRRQRALRFGAVVIALVWWAPSLLLTVTGLLLDRLRFALAMVLVDVLRGLGRQDAALRVLEAARRRCERRLRTLAGRRGCQR